MHWLGQVKVSASQPGRVSPCISQQLPACPQLISRLYLRTDRPSIHLFILLFPSGLKSIYVQWRPGQPWNVDHAPHPTKPRSSGRQKRNSSCPSGYVCMVSGFRINCPGRCHLMQITRADTESSSMARQRRDESATIHYIQVRSQLFNLRAREKFYNGVQTQAGRDVVKIISFLTLRVRTDFLSS